MYIYNLSHNFFSFFFGKHAHGDWEAIILTGKSRGSGIGTLSVWELKISPESAPLTLLVNRHTRAPNRSHHSPPSN